MANYKHTDALTIREIEYTILIKDKDKGFHELNEILRSELTRFDVSREKHGGYENPIRDFLKTNIDRSIVIRDSTRVYFLNYQERGSLTIQFTLLILTRYINYGATRQAVDYLIKDTIGNYFEELLERHLPVSVSVHSSDNELYEIPGKHNISDARPKLRRDYLPLVLSAFALVCTLSLGFIWVFLKNEPAKVNTPVDGQKDKYLELLIDNKINEALQKKGLKITEYYSPEPDSDSGLNINSQQKK
jgi:hypothetical protein